MNHKELMREARADKAYNDCEAFREEAQSIIAMQAVAATNALYQFCRARPDFATERETFSHTLECVQEALSEAFKLVAPEEAASTEKWERYDEE